MKTHILALMAAMALTLYESQMAVAQWSPLYGSVTQGMFGPRVIGRPSYGTTTMGTFGYRSVGSQLVQGPGNFTGNIQISPYGGYVINNPSYGYQVVNTNPTAGLWYENNMLSSPAAQALTYGSTLETNMGEGIGPTMQGNPANFGAAQENSNFGAAPMGTTPGAMQPRCKPCQHAAGYKLWRHAAGGSQITWQHAAGCKSWHSGSKCREYHPATGQILYGVGHIRPPTVILPLARVVRPSDGHRA